MAQLSTMTQSTPRAAALRVLVVEDNAADAMVAGAAVARAANGPYALLHAEKLADALDVVADGDVHLVLLDLNLPDSGGVETMRRMRSATRSPILVVTSDDDPGLEDAALDEGAYEVLYKGRLGVDALARLLRLADARRRDERWL